MQHPGFFERAGPFAIRRVAETIGAEMASNADPGKTLQDVRPLDRAGPSDLTFVDNQKYLGQVSQTSAGACIVAPAHADKLPPTTHSLIMDKPYFGFAAALWLFYPGATHPIVGGPSTGFQDGAGRSALGGYVSPTARLEDGVIIEPGAVVSAEAEIGSGTRISAGAIIGYRCCIGRDCFIGPGASITHALIGDRVIVHAGVRMGQDGFGFAMGPDGHRKVPQIGRVIIQDDVEIGANCCIDRGALNDTIIGEGTKIDNMVQIGHNAVIGRHCVLVAQVGISGSATLGDFVAMGGQSGAAGHIMIGAGAQIAGASHVKDDVAPGARLVGTPAIPIRDWGRQRAAMQRLANKGSEGK